MWNVYVRSFMIGKNVQMTKYKTGILTLSAAQNYGAVLQSFSLCRFLNENYCHSEIIDFTPSFVVERYPIIIWDWSSGCKFLRSIISNLFNAPFRYIKYRKFQIFRKNNFFYSKKKFIKRYDDDDYDLYVVGSDQVFNLQLTNFDTEYFLPHIKGTKKVCYAASLGVSHLTPKQELMLKRGLCDFDKVSIRESVGCRMVQELLPEKNVIKMIDPVFLNPKEFWISMCVKKRRIKRKYVLIYAFEAFEKAYEIAKRFRGGDALIVSVNDSIKKLKQDVYNLRGVGPTEFLSLIYNAELIITDSFHGTAFSIIFNREFYSIPYKGTESRIEDLLGLFALKDRLVTEQTEIVSYSSIDYDFINKEIANLTKKTMAFFDDVYEGRIGAR